MRAQPSRVAVIGGATLLGREVAQQITTSEPGWSLTLLDESDAAGQVTAAGDEALVITPLSPGALSGFDLIFFASSADTARTHVAEAVAAGATVVDLTGALAGEPGFPTASTWIERRNAAAPLVGAKGISVPHPAALALAMVASRLVEPASLITTVLQPASHYGKTAVDELQRQTAALLTFQPVPREVFDAQSAFNLLSGFGEDSKHRFAESAATIRRDFTELVPSASLEMQLIQVPVFHGFALSVFLPNGDVDDVRSRLDGAMFELIASDARLDIQSMVEDEDIRLSIKVSQSASGKGLWMWIAADNLRLSAKHAVACAQQALPAASSRLVQ